MSNKFDVKNFFYERKNFLEKLLHICVDFLNVQDKELVVEQWNLGLKTMDQFIVEDVSISGVYKSNSIHARSTRHR